MEGKAVKNECVKRNEMSISTKLTNDKITSRNDLTDASGAAHSLSHLA